MNLRILSVFCTLLICSSLAMSQTSRPQEMKPAGNPLPRIEVFGSIAAAHIFRFEDQGFGTKANAGVGVEVTVWHSLRAGAEVNTTFGLSPSPFKCGGILPGPGQPPYPCTGSARVGVGAATAASFTAAWYFGSGRVKPYILGGLSILKTEQYSSWSIVRTDHVELREISSRATGAGPAFGIGVHALLTRRLSLRPELRFSDGTAMSSANMSQVRFSVGLGYGWSGIGAWSYLHLCIYNNVSKIEQTQDRGQQKQAPILLRRAIRIRGRHRAGIAPCRE